MTYRFCVTLLLSIAAGIFQIAAVVPSAECQSMTTWPQDASVHQAQQTSASNISPPEEGQPSWPGRLQAYMSFIDVTANDDAVKRREEEAGKEQSAATHTLGKFIHIREDEEQAMYSILRGTYQKIRENSNQFSIANDEANLTRSPEAIAKRDLLGRQFPIIYRSVFTRLRQELGEESFIKLDAYIYTWWGAGMKDGHWIPYESMGYPARS